MTSSIPVFAEPRKRGRPNRAAADAAIGIRRAALQAFARAGFRGASIAEIAQMAGVAKPLVHYHYASKDLLWQAAVGEAVAELRKEFEVFQVALATPFKAEEVLRTVARQLVMFASRHPELVQIVVDETGKGGDRADWLKANLLVPGYATAKILLTGWAQLTGQPAPAVEHLVPFVLGAMNFPFLDAQVIRTAYEVDVYTEAYVDRHGEILFQVLRTLLSKD